MLQKLVLPLLFIAQLAAGQSFSIRIELLENNKTPIVGATVKLTDRSDTTQFRNAISDSQGMVNFSVPADRQYILEAAYTGFEPLQKGITVNANSRNFRFNMNESATSLQTVTVKATRPLMRQEDDKTIVDPEPLVNSSTSVYEVLEKTPGLFLDQDGNVYLSSATPATIYINGREQKMSASDIASMLKSLPPNSIEKIEILRAPSARYDASGSGGIVNVVLKKGVKIGRVGSANAGMNQGHYGNQNIGFSLNNSDGGRTSSLHLNYSLRNGYDQLLTRRQLTPDSLLTQDAYTTTPGQNLFAGYSLGFEPSEKWSFDFDGRATLGINNSGTRTENQILGAGQLLADNLNDLHNDGRSLFINQGAAAKYKLDTLGSEWTTDVSYNFQRGKNGQDFTLFSILPVSPTNLGGLGDIDNNRHFFAAQVDLKYKFPHTITFETGAKSSLQRFENATVYSIVINDLESPDPFRTNSFTFKDNINAAYAQASKGWGAFILKAGVRLENTQMTGRQSVPSDTSFRIRRTDLFPYVYLSRRVATIAGYDLRAFLVYRRSITRPAYSYLNPFPRFLDQYLYEAGNPSLRPQFTENYEANISFNEMPIFALGRNYTQDIFTNVIYADPSLPGVAYRTYDNLGKNEETYFKVVGALPPGGAYFFVAGAQYNYNKYNGLYEGRPLTFERGSWSFFTYHQLRLGSRSMVTLHGFYRLKGQLQFYELSDFGALSMSINRQFFNKKLTITLSANDIFFTNNNRFSINQGSITATGERYSDTRRFGLNVRYSFGLKRKEESTNMFNLDGMDKN